METRYVVVPTNNRAMDIRRFIMELQIIHPQMGPRELIFHLGRGLNISTADCFNELPRTLPPKSMIITFVNEEIVMPPMLTINEIKGKVVNIRPALMPGCSVIDPPLLSLRCEDNIQDSGQTINSGEIVLLRAFDENGQNPGKIFLEDKGFCWWDPSHFSIA